MIKITNFPKYLITRQHYINKVLPFIGKNIIKVFTGQRRVGKSYLLFQLIQQINTEQKNATILYINKEDLVFSAIKTANDLNDYVKKHQSKTGKTYVFIDEIQDIADFNSALRSLLLDETLDIYCTGSNANMLSQDIAGNLSGRFIEITVYSLSYTEFLVFHSLEDTQETLEKFLKFGGLPYLKHLPLEEIIAFEYLKNIYSTIVYRDIINRFAIRNTVFLEQLVLFLSSNIGSIFSIKKISDFLKSQKTNMPPNQVQLYVQHLSDAFLLHRVPRYDIVGKRLFEVGEKYYFENLGIRNALWGYRLEDRGKIIENVVYNQLLFLGYQVQVGVIGSHEVDFVASKGGEKWYLQVALTINDLKTIEREFGNLMRIKDNFRKTVITLDRYQGASYQGIEVIDLRSFLKV
ncbi:ATP-binding protein [Polaribacter gangjinensis]|uniref:ATPase n=1 Tax=Polaribacter gangjinensis TaxID=574710 RepID=A0A2S7W851_9FLAO|nr:ATP-binding protein [Polaribacter gangjinensis]PQJ73773.1 ATPase [Polaribacter gangjinensis]